jgi:copper chaperone NosL
VTAIPGNRLASIVLSALVATLGCGSAGPGVIHYDVDACDHCRMTISDPAFAGQVVLRTGKIYRFDDPSCLVSFVTSGHAASAEVDGIWLNDHAHPDARIKIPDAVFVVSDRIRAPMNGRTAAFASRGDAAAFQASVGGQLQAWTDLLKRGAS